MRKSLHHHLRNRGGGSIAEFAPALGLLLIFFFPLVDVLCLGVSYGLCMVLNYNQVHEASLIPASEAQAAVGIIKKGVPDAWRKGLGPYGSLFGTPQTLIAYRDGQTGSDSVTDKIVRVQTTVRCLPCMTIPLPVVNVPGLNGPMTFAIYGERPMENPDFVQQ